MLAAAFALIVPAFVNGSPTPAIRYVLTQPDGGEDSFWAWPNHGDSAWKRAESFREIGAAIRNARSTEAWIRMEADLTAASVNNSYFRIRHSGPVEVYVNGLKRVVATEAASDFMDYPSGRRRPESIGRNVYAIHFQHKEGAEPVLDIEWRSAPWTAPPAESRFPDPVLPDAIRDAQVCPGPDGAYYLTGTTGDEAFLKPGPDAWLRGPGIQVFKSTDLRHWKSLGWVWTFERDGTWNKEFGTFGERGPARGIFAPEIHYLKGKFWLVYSVNHTTPKHRFGIGLACAERPEGPWREMSPDHPLTEGFDPSLFEDDDGKVYLLKHGGEISELSADMTRLVSPARQLTAENFPSVGYEGVCLFKSQGKYFLTAAEWNVHEDGTQSYDSMVAVSTNLFGPYGPRQCALRYGGHNGYFHDANGNLQATIWCYPDHDPHWQKTSIVPMRIGPHTSGQSALMPAGLGEAPPGR
ncbi:MAG: family 43 glycosylhydrolase [Verrucomicrobia bacterium]|nr:family 43 glycosylhydrolase [Verrucomicrobiota bacterium]